MVQRHARFEVQLIRPAIVDDLELRRIRARQAQIVGAETVVGDRNIRNLGRRTGVAVLGDRRHGVGQIDRRRRFIHIRDRQAKRLRRIHTADRGVIYIDGHIKLTVRFMIERDTRFKVQLIRPTIIDNLKLRRIRARQAQIVGAETVVRDGDVSDLRRRTRVAVLGDRGHGVREVHRCRRFVDVTDRQAERL